MRVDALSGAHHSHLVTCHVALLADVLVRADLRGRGSVPTSHSPTKYLSTTTLVPDLLLLKKWRVQGVSEI